MDNQGCVVSTRRCRLQSRRHARSPGLPVSNTHAPMPHDTSAASPMDGSGTARRRVKSALATAFQQKKVRELRIAALRMDGCNPRSRSRTDMAADRSPNENSNCHRQHPHHNSVTQALHDRHPAGNGLHVSPALPRATLRRTRAQHGRVSSHWVTAPQWMLAPVGLSTTSTHCAQRQQQQQQPAAVNTLQQHCWSWAVWERSRTGTDGGCTAPRTALGAAAA